MWILTLVELLSSQHPGFVSTSLHSGNEVGVDQANLLSQFEEVGVGEAAGTFWGLHSEKCLPELVEVTSFRSQGEGVVGPYRLRTQKATHSILNR